MDRQKADIIAGFFAGFTAEGDHIKVEVMGDRIKVHDLNTDDKWDYSRVRLLKQAHNAMAGMFGGDGGSDGE